MTTVTLVDPMLVYQLHRKTLCLSNISRTRSCLSLTVNDFLSMTDMRWSLVRHLRKWDSWNSLPTYGDALQQQYGSQCQEYVKTDHVCNGRQQRARGNSRIETGALENYGEHTTGEPGRQEIDHRGERDDAT